jgi:hypothetical protein
MDIGGRRGGILKNTFLYFMWGINYTNVIDAKRREF